jgi:hypothetical protein
MSNVSTASRIRFAQWLEGHDERRQRRQVNTMRCEVTLQVAVVILLPAPPGYVGIIQGCFTAVLALYDVDPSLTVAASVYYHLWQYVPVTLVGLYCLQRTGLRLSDVTQTAPN